MAKIGITMGDPAGIGAEIILKSLNCLSALSDLIIIGNREIFSRAETISNINLPSSVNFIDIPFETSKIKNGIENAYSGELAYLCLKQACKMAKNGIIQSIATAPLSKNALHLAGHSFSGQTEILEKELAQNTQKAQMLFVADKLRILLLTRHIALKNISKNITSNTIKEAVNIFNHELIQKFKITSPKLAICALNPHAGENGILGDEEIKTINPAIKNLKDKGINISGAFSADTLLGKAIKNHSEPDFDGYIACYHDQALPAIKSLGLENVLNVTIGLNTLRVSPSHGTAFDIAYKNIADHRSMLNSIKFLQRM